MKTLALILMWLPVTLFAQYDCIGANDLGFLKSEVYGNTVVLMDDTVCRNCDSYYDMQIYPLAGDTLIWFQKELSGMAFCDCIFNLSVTIDSLNPGNYFVKTFYDFSDTVFVGLISFTIEEQNSFNTYIKTGEFQSACFSVSIDEGDPLQNPVSIKPNPATDEILVFSPLTTGEIICRVFDLNGSVLKEEMTHSRETKINITELPLGIYFVRVRDEARVTIGKFIKGK